jgi:hypothetical protein
VGRWVETGYEVEMGGFPGTIGTDDAQYFRVKDIEI